MSINLTAMVLDANPDRNSANLFRRATKLLEELGEIAEARLNITSASNAKGKTWDDVREEIADVLIVSFDIALTPIPQCVSHGDLPSRVRNWTAPVFGGVFRETAENFNDRLAMMVKSLSKVMQSLLNKDWHSLSEDMLSLAVNAASFSMVPMPDRIQQSESDRYAALEAEVTRKLDKWRKGRAARTDAVSEDAV